MYIENSSFSTYEGYGRFATYIFKELRKRHLPARPIFSKQIECRSPIIRQYHLIEDDKKLLTINPPFFATRQPNPHYLYTMTEGTELPDGWATDIVKANIRTVIVPSTYCHETFAKYLPPSQKVVTVIPGTDPYDFPVIEQTRHNKPYTFLTFADRGPRKGWIEVWESFFNTFLPGEDVRLIIKHRKYDCEFLSKLAANKGLDSRITFDTLDYENIQDLYAQIDCLLLPSRSEGWGMIHRECAMSGIPVVTLKYSGLDDGNIEKWSIPVHNYTLERLPLEAALVKGYCAIADRDELGSIMRDIFENPTTYKHFAVHHAAPWLRENQTWSQTLDNLLGVINGT